MSKNGFFITLEGGEGSGKTTQIKALADKLKENGYEVATTREPGGTKTAEAMRNLFVAHKGSDWPLATQALLMFAARNHHTETLIKPALEKGNIVICDRYTDSTRVYQGYAGGMDIAEIEAMKKVAIGDFEPDVTFVMDIDPEIGLSRGQDRGNDTDTTFETKALMFHKNLREGYLDIAERYPERCHVIDASQSVEVITDVIQKTVLDRLSK